MIKDKRMVWLKLGIPLLALFAIAGLWTWGNGWKKDANEYLAEINAIVSVTKTSSGNNNVTRKNVKEQISALGDSNRILKISIDNQNAAIDQLAREAVEARAKSEELQKIADRALAQRRSAMSRLEEMTVTPGTRGDCEQLLSEANRALDIVYEAGL